MVGQELPGHIPMSAWEPSCDQDLCLLPLSTWNPGALLPFHRPLQSLGLTVIVLGFPGNPAVSFLSFFS